MPSSSKPSNSPINISNEKCKLMPVQINEVIIRAVVDDGPGAGPASETAASAGSIITDAELVEKVLEILKEKGER